MHALKPNTEYRIVKVLLVVPNALQEAEITDFLNEMLNGVLDEYETSMRQDAGIPPTVADWAFPNGGDGPVFKTGAIVEEGEWNRAKR
jgi:hypothetical protein